MKGLEKSCPRLRRYSGSDNLEGYELISIAKKLPRYNCRFEPQEEILKIIVDWIAENDFLIPTFQVCGYVFFHLGATG